MNKSLLLSLMIALSLSPAVKGQLPEPFIGQWTGTGTLYNQDASFSMKWEKVLNNEFVRLTFGNRLDNGSFSMQATGMYRIESDGTVKGSWFDSRGVHFPLNGKTEGSRLTVHWGTEDFEQGKTVYILTGPEAITVTDYVMKNGNYTKFGEATYTKKT